LFHIAQAEQRCFIDFLDAGYFVIFDKGQTIFRYQIAVVSDLTEGFNERFIIDLSTMGGRRLLDNLALTGPEDAHPALTDRLRAIGAAPRLALPAPGQASDCLLGEARTRIARELDRRWRRTIRPSWEKRYRAAQESRARFAGYACEIEAGDTAHRQGGAR